MRKIKKEEGAAWAAPFSYTIDVDKNFHIDIMRIRIILFLFLYDSFGGGLMTKKRRTNIRDCEQFPRTFISRADLSAFKGDK